MVSFFRTLTDLGRKALVGSTEMRVWCALLLAAASFSAEAQTRTYAGPFSTNWRTVGKHGHDQPWCAEPTVTNFPNGGVLVHTMDCNALDFARGNLDNSIGFRTGRERDLFAKGPFVLVAGVEAGMSYTEYNLSQSDFVFAAAAGLAGADLRLGHFSIGGRYGFGPFATSDGGEYGFQRFQGLQVTLPLRAGAAIQISQRSMRVLDFSPVQADVVRREPRATETSVLLVASPDYSGSSKWEFSAATGTTTPGAGYVGSSRGLRSSAYSQVAADRELPWRDLHARVTWSSSAHESALETEFLGYRGNFRSKTIDGFGVAVGSTRRLNDRFSWRYSGGIEVSDWRDEHQLLTRDGAPLVGGVETGLSADFGVRWHLGRNLALETSFEQLYWQRLDLGEGRVGFGLVVTR